MCGRFTLSATPAGLIEEFTITDAPVEYSPRYNIAPSQDILSIVNGEHLRFEYFRWGLIPFWAKDEKTGYRMINARSESLGTKKTFKGLLKKNRCLIAADGFYEWQKVGKRKIPQYIFLKSKSPFAFAGLWSAWKDPQGNSVKSCTIITTDANKLLKPIHDRMPVILNREDRSRWLDPEFSDDGGLTALLIPYDPNEMEYYAVSTWVNSPGHEGDKCIRSA
jgi:putative SOS response-associated peptidase YedK